MYAIISAGNKQYKVSQGETIYIDKVNQADGSAISFDAIMVVNEGDVKVGTPTVAGVTVEGKIGGQVKGEKSKIYTLPDASRVFPSRDIPAMRRKAATSSARAFPRCSSPSTKRFAAWWGFPPSNTAVKMASRRCCCRQESPISRWNRRSCCLGRFASDFPTLRSSTPRIFGSRSARFIEPRP